MVFHYAKSGYVGGKFTTNKTERREIMEETPLVVERAFYEAPQNSLQRVLKQLQNNLGVKAGTHKLRGMTSNQVIELDKKILQETAISNNDEESPLIAPTV